MKRRQMHQTNLNFQIDLLCNFKINLSNPTLWFIVSLLTKKMKQNTESKISVEMDHLIIGSNKIIKPFKLNNNFPKQRFI